MAICAGALHQREGTVVSDVLLIQVMRKAECTSLTFDILIACTAPTGSRAWSYVHCYSSR